MKKILITALSAVALISTASASGLVSGLIVEDVRIDRSGLGFVVFESVLTDSPASCASTPHNRHLSFNSTTAGGDNVMKLALAAKALGKPISARGSGTCLDYTVVESWQYGWIED